MARFILLLMFFVCAYLGIFGIMKSISDLGNEKKKTGRIEHKIIFFYLCLAIVSIVISILFLCFALTL